MSPAFPIKLSEAARNPVAPKKKKQLREQCDTTCPDLGAKIF
jgi:hypothetical protein